MPDTDLDIIDPEAELAARIHSRSCAYLEESEPRKKDMAPTARADLCHKAACLFETMHWLTFEVRMGRASIDKLKAIGSLHSEYRRTLSMLGLDAGQMAEEEAPEI